MQILVSINNCDVILTNQILNRGNSLAIRLMKCDSISRKNFTT